MSFDEFNPGIGVMYFCPLALDKSLVTFSPSSHHAIPSFPQALLGTQDGRGVVPALKRRLRTCVRRRGRWRHLCSPGVRSLDYVCARA